MACFGWSSVPNSHNTANIPEHGYWDGITPGSDIAKSYVTKEYLWKDNVKGIDRHLSLISPSVCRWPIPKMNLLTLSQEAERFYDDFYNYLKSQGVDCCKTDVQSRIDELSNGTDKKELMPAYQKALKKASMFEKLLLVFCTPLILRRCQISRWQVDILHVTYSFNSFRRPDWESHYSSTGRANV